MSAVAHLHPQFVVDQQGQRQQVLLSMAEYEALLEDLADLAAVAERRDEAVVDHNEVLRQLKADGLL